MNNVEYGLKDYQLKTIIDYFARHNEIEEAVLFGSRAIGSYKKGSDVDIALKGKYITPFIAAELKSELEDETVIPFFFDFVSYSQLTHKEFINHIDTYGITIYKK